MKRLAVKVEIDTGDIIGFKMPKKHIPNAEVEYLNNSVIVLREQLSKKENEVSRLRKDLNQMLSDLESGILSKDYDDLRRRIRAIIGY